jgi:hypothetical protein
MVMKKGKEMKKRRNNNNKNKKKEEETEKNKVFSRHFPIRLLRLTDLYFTKANQTTSERVGERESARGSSQLS